MPGNWVFNNFFRYLPTRLWGYSGHVQTILQGFISRLYCPLVNGRRQSFKASDGATVTYDIYQPIEKHSTGGKTSNKTSLVLVIGSKWGRCTAIWQFYGLLSVPWELSPQNLAGLNFGSRTHLVKSTRLPDSRPLTPIKELSRFF